ncbi:MAG: DUF72 domain-containing protein [bacterium]|nr:DUF72 domain-containing protein [bacterium]
MDHLIKIGTSGYSFADWKGEIYPRSLAPVNMLPYYEQEIGFNAVELNFTYYRQPSAKAIAGMVRKTRRDFQFTVKANKAMTHDLKAADGQLKNNQDVFEEFLSGIEPLIVNNQLGAVLAQFPVMFDNNEENRDYLARFKEIMGKVPVVVEFRNNSWAKTGIYQFLKENGFGWCSVDEPQLPRLLPMVTEVTGDIGYFRFHGRNPHWFNVPIAERYNYLYSKEELEEFVPKIRRVSAKTKITYLFFNNCHGGKAVKNALQLMELLEIKPNTATLF